MATYEDLLTVLKKVRPKKRSYWERGVMSLAIDIVEYAINNNDCSTIELPRTWEETEKFLLLGADDWRRYVEGGCSLIYNGDIVDCLLTPSEKKRWNGGPYVPGGYRKGYTLLELLIRAEYQAALWIGFYWNELVNKKL
jgi:hypothetical protein